MKRSEKTNRKGLVFNAPDYSILIKYGKGKNSKNVKFIPKEGRPFEIDSEKIVDLLAKHVNFEVVAPAYIKNRTINMVRVNRGITFTPNRDIKAGETVNIPFYQMMPIEFAIAEEALGVLTFDEKVKQVNAKEFAKASRRVKGEVEEFVKEQYNAMLREMQNNPNSS